MLQPNKYDFEFQLSGCDLHEWILPGVAASRYSFIQFGTFRMEKDQLLPDSARLQLASLRDADYALHEIPGKQRHFISSLYDCIGIFLFNIILRFFLLTLKAKFYFRALAR